MKDKIINKLIKLLILFNYCYSNILMVVIVDNYG